jgi:hypothetical protein
MGGIKSEFLPTLHRDCDATFELAMKILPEIEKELLKSNKIKDGGKKEDGSGTNNGKSGENTVDDHINKNKN